MKIGIRAHDFGCLPPVRLAEKMAAQGVGGAAGHSKGHCRGGELCAGDGRPAARDRRGFPGTPH